MYSEYKKAGKLFSGCGLMSFVGLVSYEAYRIHSALSNLVDTRVLDIDRKRPDYIYIKHHIYRQSLLEQLEQERQDGRLVNVVVQPFEKWWKTFKHSVAWRLLKIAQEGDQSERLKAVRQLALIDHLKDWDFQHLAQLCDAQTAVSLARSNCDSRWFLPPRQYGVEKEIHEVLVEVKGLIEKLVPNKCAEYVLEHTFTPIKEPVGDEGVSYRVSVTQFETETLKQALSALVHLTTTEENCRKIIDAGGLLALIEVEKHFKDSIDIKLMLSRIMANLSVCEDRAYDFFASGWIGIMSRWQKDIDMRMQVTTDIALSNLDRDDPNGFNYESNVYPLYPKGRRKNKPDVDVVFIHGLLGGVFVTWRQKDLKPQAASLLGKKHVSVNLVSSLAKGDNGDGRAETSSTNTPTTTTTTTRDSSIPTKFPLFYWSAKKSSFDEDQAGIRTEEGITSYKDELLPLQQSPKKIRPSISDTATKELIQALREEEPLSSEWSVVFPDLPILAEEKYTSPAVRNTEGRYSVSGEQWLQEPLGDESVGRSFCWPMEWLPKDFPNIRVIGLNYDSSLSQWSASGCPCEKYDGKLEKRAAEFLQKLANSEIGQDRPVVWVGHSMGGLLIKSIIVQASTSENPAVRRIAENSRAIMFLGTPHRGSAVAKLKQHTSALIWPSVEVRELEENSKQLLHLNKTFLKTIGSLKRKPEIVSICEGVPTALTSFKFPIHIVPEVSARIDEGDFYMTKEDHLNLSKPMCRQTFLYQRLISTIFCAMQSAKHTDEGQEAHEKVSSAKGTDVGKMHSSVFSDVYRQLRQLDRLFNIFL
ncbi:protein SERAC1 isoform X2 [Toxorhynchites rutilus septentrionalis]|uniref:protein SERAC1 isoform X2 n=1 Tax=Toxorhynchites rutilus septentrionalis TaxID=329112 RepID=UPI00247A3CA2|nr:protein SERAC1 isoform X2 [Toxorhynchites rutilus septentrionalis]